MSAIFNAREGFELAEEIERNGAKFYRRAAELAGAWPEARKVVLALAGMEDEHERIFHALKLEFTTDDLDEALPDADQQALTYLREMGEAKVFGNREDLAARLVDAISLQEIYRLAIGFEKDSILFFTAIRKLVPNDLGRNKIDMLITEEVAHVAMLSRELKKIGGTATA